MRFVGIKDSVEFRIVKRMHIITWRDSLKNKKLSNATIQRKLAALSDLFKFLCDKNSVSENPVSGVTRPSETITEGKTPAISADQAIALLKAPPQRTLKGKRDRAILAVLLFHAIRREELCRLRVKDITERKGVTHLRIHGKGDKKRFDPGNPIPMKLIEEYLAAAGHANDLAGPLFRNCSKSPKHRGKGISGGSIFRNVVFYYGRRVGIKADLFGPHSLRSTAATEAFRAGATLKEVMDWLGHSDPATTLLYLKLKTRPEDSPTFKIRF